MNCQQYFNMQNLLRSEMSEQFYSSLTKALQDMVSMASTDVNLFLGICCFVILIKNITINIQNIHLSGDTCD